MVDMTESIARQMPTYRDHLKRYLLTDGEDGYFVDLTGSRPYPGLSHTPALILRTLGRKSGKVYLDPLVYVPYGDEYIIVGSKGGHDEHPSWALNLRSRPEVEFQVRGARYRARWIELEGERREKLWPYIIQVFPNFQAYRERTDRQLPVFLMTPYATIAEKWTPPEATA
jgi:deazaflavin-dependent oxidoreductase (nitroreductase family)